MSIEYFPGNLRIGVFDMAVNGVENPRPDEIQPKFQILVLLSGRQSFYLDHIKIDLDASDGVPVAIMMNIAKPCMLKFAGSFGDPFRKIALAAPANWLDLFTITHLKKNDKGPVPKQILSNHLDHLIWQPSSEIIRLTEQIISPPPGESETQQGLFRMSRGLEIMRRAIEDCLHDEVAMEPNSLVQSPEAIRLHVLSNLCDDLSLEQLEHNLGLNRRSIQRIFKSEYGITLRCFIRVERLKLANRALQNQGASIASAAHMAGYSSPANFATAFRKEFGSSPNSMRNRAM